MTSNVDTNEITKLESPIDIQYFIHKALTAEARRVVAVSDGLTLTGGLSGFREKLGVWVSALGYHATNEDKYMTGPLDNSMVARENEEEHARLVERIGEVLTCLDKEIGEGEMTARSHRHLYGTVVALQVGMEDHLEEEEEFVIPLIKDRVSAEEELEIARRLIIDDDAKNKEWIIDWMNKDLSANERKLVGALVERF